MDIFERILEVLYYSGSERKSVIARKADISYDNFVRYLEFIEILDLVIRNSKGESETIMLSDNGRSFCMRRFGQPQ